MTYKYDVCLSFAGEQRAYVEQVAQHLKRLNVKYFYDQEQAGNLWGQDLVETFDEVFGRDSRFCVMFISQDYAEKVWTRHEKRSILERQLNETSPYILPVHFDATRLPGLASTIHYQDANKLTPVELAKMIQQRVEGTPASSEQEAPPEPSAAEFRLPKNQKSKFSTYAAMSQFIDDTVQELKRRGEALEVHGTPFFYRETAGRHMFRFGNDKGSPIYSLVLSCNEERIYGSF